jgi:hypothetical protein
MAQIESYGAKSLQTRSAQRWEHIRVLTITIKVNNEHMIELAHMYEIFWNESFSAHFRTKEL